MIHLKDHAAYIPSFLTTHSEKMSHDLARMEVKPDDVWTNWRDKSAGVLKQSLEAASHQKCAWCESFLNVTCTTEIDHYRPKSKYRWLMFRWDNLLPSCRLCNTSKSSSFPLWNEADRATGPDDILNNEKPLLINPATENPSVDIQFDEHWAVAVNHSNRGRATINQIGLNRPQLCEERRTWLKMIGLMLKEARRNGNYEAAKDELTSGRSKYSAASQANVARLKDGDGG